MPTPHGSLLPATWAISVDPERRCSRRYGLWRGAMPTPHGSLLPATWAISVDPERRRVARYADLRRGSVLAQRAVSPPRMPFAVRREFPRHVYVCPGSTGRGSRGVRAEPTPHYAGGSVAAGRSRGAPALRFSASRRLQL